MAERNVTGSNKASSYLRALDLLVIISERHSSLKHRTVLWQMGIQQVKELYEYTIARQKLKDSEFLKPDLPPSYGKNGYYSAALKSFGEFLAAEKYESNLLAATKGTIKPEDFSRNAELVDFPVSIFRQEDDAAVITEKYRFVKIRARQRFFRQEILKNYTYKCAITGLNIPEVLRASHITRWSEDKKNRLNPSNGICLSATFDAAFDRHLISFDDNYCLVFGGSIKAYAGDAAFEKHIAPFEGQALNMPARFLPDPALLKKHRDSLVA